MRARARARARAPFTRPALLGRLGVLWLFPGKKYEETYLKVPLGRDPRQDQAWRLLQHARMRARARERERETERERTRGASC